MVGVCFSDVFYSEIVNIDVENNQAPLFFSETRSAFAFVITLFVEALFK